MSVSFGEVTLTKEELQQAMQILEHGCSGALTIVFTDKRLAGIEALDVSQPFAIEPKSVHCMYGCKKQKDIVAAITGQKGLVTESC